MHLHQSLQSLADTFLQHLGREESLLRDALTHVNSVYEALRRGDLVVAENCAAQIQPVVAELHETATIRATSATALAREVGLTDEELTLSVLAANLPDSLASELRVARERLTAVTAELTAIHTRNANLIGHLRSYFRGVLSSLTAPNAPQRYGRSGDRLTPTLGGAIRTQG